MNQVTYHSDLRHPDPILQTLLRTLVSRVSLMPASRELTSESGRRWLPVRIEKDHAQIPSVN